MTINKVPILQAETKVRQRPNKQIESAETNHQLLHPLVSLQQHVGNIHFGRMIAQRNNNDLIPVGPEVGLEGGLISDELAGRIEAECGNGRPLDETILVQMETLFGVDFSNVRIHTDGEADALSRSISARAFTIGNDIFFRYSVSPNDTKLLAHELIHVIQQRSMNMSAPMIVGPANDSFEQEADQIAPTVLAKLQDRSYYNEASQLAVDNTGLDITKTSQATEASIQREEWLDYFNTFSNITDTVSLSTELITTANNVPGVSTIADTLAEFNSPAVQTLNKVLGPIGLITGGVGLWNSIDRMSNEGELLQGGTDALFNAAGLFSGGVSTAGLLGIGTTALSPVASVAGAAAGGYGIGNLSNQATDFTWDTLLGEKSYSDAIAELFGQSPSESNVYVGSADHSISGAASEGAVAIDQAISGLWADPDKPAYTQTLGWKLGEWLGI